MRVHFWGTRGSIATPGPGTNHFGGNTSCVELVTSGGEILVLDCGTGARVLGVHLMKQAARSIEASVLLGHTHWDHIQGFPFFLPVFMPGNRFDVFAPEGGRRSLQETLAGQMEYTYFPVELGQLPTVINYRELTEGTYQIGSVRVVTQYLNHPAMTLGYRLEADNLTVTYLSDHEPFFEGIWRPGADSRQLDSILHEGDRRHAKFMAGADLVIHDAQYTAEEYKSKKNWGHSPFEYVVEMAAAAGVRRLALTHHDPSHNDDFVAEIECRAQALAHARDPRLEVFCAFEGYELELTPAGEHHPFANAMAEPHAPRRRPFSRILVINGDDDAGRSIKTALGAEGFILIQVDSARAAFESIAETTPDLVLADLADPTDDKAEFVQAFRPGGAAANIPLLVLSGEDPSLLSAAGIDPASIDYLPRPFTIPQLRARVRARLERGSSK